VRTVEQLRRHHIFAYRDDPASLHGLYALDSLFHLDSTLEAGFSTDLNRTLGPSLDACVSYKVNWQNRLTLTVGGSLDVGKFYASGFYWELGYIPPIVVNETLAFVVRL
jgi:hypothetical protein